MKRFWYFAIFKLNVALERRLNALALIRSVEDGRFRPRSSILQAEEKTLRHI